MNRKTSLAISFLFAFLVVVAIVTNPDTSSAQVTPSKYNGTGVRVLVFSTAKVMTTANVFHLKSSNGSTRKLKLDFSQSGLVDVDTETDDKLYLGSHGYPVMILDDADPFLTVDLGSGAGKFNIGHTDQIDALSIFDSSGWQFSSPITTMGWSVDANSATSKLNLTNHQLNWDPGNQTQTASKRGFVLLQSGGSTQKAGLVMGGGTDFYSGTFGANDFEVGTHDTPRLYFPNGDGQPIQWWDESMNILGQIIDDGTGSHFAMAGTVKSTNLNADLLDGIDSTGFLTALHGVMTIYGGVAAPEGSTSTVWTTTWPTGAPVTALGSCSFDPITPGIGAGNCTYKFNDTTAATSCTVTYMCGTGTVATQACTSGNAVSMTAGDTITVSLSAAAANTGSIGNLACNY